jgi:hypothetical protein
MRVLQLESYGHAPYSSSVEGRGRRILSVGRTSSLIDLTTGAFTLPTVALRIAPTLTRDEFLQSSTGHSVLIENAPWMSYILPQQSLADAQFRVAVYFKHDRVDSVQLAHPFPDRDESWANWSKATEFDRKAFHDEWLNNNGITRDAYDWGTVHSDFDQKSGGSVIIFRYQ